MRKILSLLLIVAMVVGCTTQTGEFVTVKEGKFFIGDTEYRYVGTNLWYGAILGSEGRGGNRERLCKELDDLKSIGITNVRVLVGGDGREDIPSHIEPVLQTAPGVYNDTILNGLDYLMAELEKRDMKAVLYINNAWEWSGGYGAYLEWAGYEMDFVRAEGDTVHFDKAPIPSEDGWREYMQYVSEFVLNDSAKSLAAEHVRFIVSRTNSITGKPYTESPALMSWEIANEPRCFGNDSIHKAKFVEWIDEQSSLIKSIDPNHLVTTGSEGYHGCEDDMELFNAIHTLPNIDYACIHIWPFNWGWLGEYKATTSANKVFEGDDPVVSHVDVACQNTLQYIDDAYSLMSKAGRPIVLEEFGYPRDCAEVADTLTPDGKKLYEFVYAAGSPTIGRDTYFKYVFSIIKDSGKIAGCNFWGWGGSANVKNVIWSRWDDYVGDPAQEEQGLNSVFWNDTSTISIIKEFTRR